MKVSFFKIILGTFIIFGIFALSGCANTTFGVDKETWSQLTPQQKQTVIKSYYKNQAAEKVLQAEQEKRDAARQAQIDRINAQNAPINGVISAISGAVNAQQKQCITDHFNDTVCGHNCYIDDFGTGHCAD